MSRSEAMSAAKMELAHSPYIESLSFTSVSLKHHKPLLPSKDDLYHTIADRKRAQTVLRDLQHKLASLRSLSPLPPRVLSPSRLLDRKAVHLAELQLKVKRQTEERKLRIEAQRDEILNRKRVSGRQQKVLLLKRSLIEERKLSPGERQKRREREPRFALIEESRYARRNTQGNTLTKPLYEDVLRKEQHTLCHIKEKVSSTQISILLKEVAAVHKDSFARRTKPS